ncbi:MAG: hypothetical protein RTU30_10045 [Candidatus Thorarchaeota archaeon]
MRNVREIMLVCIVAMTLVLSPLCSFGVAQPGFLTDNEATTNYNIDYTNNDGLYPDDAVTDARVQDFGNILEQIRAMYVGWGLNPPNTPLDVFIYHFAALNAWANADEMGFASYFAGNDFHGDVTRVENHTIPGHEMFHTIQLNYPLNGLPDWQPWGNLWTL